MEITVLLPFLSVSNAFDNQFTMHTRFCFCFCECSRMGMRHSRYKAWNQSVPWNALLRGFSVLIITQGSRPKGDDVLKDAEGNFRIAVHPSCPVRPCKVYQARPGLMGLLMIVSLWLICLPQALVASLMSFDNWHQWSPLGVCWGSFKASWRPEAILSEAL